MEEIRYVARDAAGAIVSSFTELQPGLAEEAVPASLAVTPGDRLRALAALVDQKEAAGVVDSGTGAVIPLDAKTRDDITSQGASAGLALSLAAAKGLPAPTATYLIPTAAGPMRLDCQGTYDLAERVRVYVEKFDVNRATLAAQIAAGADPDINAGWP